MISNIQLLRALAAIAVVFYHTNFRLWNDLHTEFQGIAIFFVISGFIIPRVAQESATKFFLSRVFRVAPLYWILTVVSLGWAFIGPIGQTAALIFASALAFPKCRFTIPRPLAFVIVAGLLIFVIRAARYAMKLGVGHVASSLFFFPETDSVGQFVFPVLGVGWTLNMEAFFYVTFAIMMLISKKLAPLLVIIALAGIRAAWEAKLCSGAFCAWYSHGYITYFIYGMVIHWLYCLAEKALANRPLPKSAVAIFAAAATGLWLAANIAPDQSPGVIGLPQWGQMAFIAPPLLVAAALACHLANLRCRWQAVAVNRRCLVRAVPGSQHSYRDHPHAHAVVPATGLPEAPWTAGGVDTFHPGRRGHPSAD